MTRSIAVAGTILLLFALFFAFRKRPEKKALSFSSRVPSSVMVPRFEPSMKPPVFDSESYYRTIIENNLFRPLGWTPPRPKEPYRLLGTLLPIDVNIPPKAILQTTATNKTHIVTIGELLDASTEVVEIKPKQVTLFTEGQRRTLKLTETQFLNPVRVSSRVASESRTPVRPPTSVRRAVSAAPSKSPSSSDRAGTFSEWQTGDGEVLRVGDARLKNPEKWGLRRRLPAGQLD